MSQFTKLPLWPFQVGVIDTSDHERKSGYQDLLMFCDHNGATIDRENTRIEVEGGTALVSIRPLTERWLWNKSKVERFLKFVLEKKLFWTQKETRFGHWLKPVFDVSETLNETPSETPNETPTETRSGTLSETQNQRSWIFKSSLNLSSKEDHDQILLSTLTQLQDQIAGAQLVVPEVVEAFEKFLKYRRTVIKKPVRTLGPLKLILREFEKATPAELVTGIDACIEHEWVAPHYEVRHPSTHRNGHTNGHAGETPEERARKIEEVRRQLALEGIIA